ncbi:MAG: adenylyltransferase/cytidyltransferase family protein [archaeon]
MKLKTGAFTGRFNPVHKGHINVIKNILSEVDKLIIGIGSSNLQDTKENPFSGKERKEMLEAYLKEEGVDMSKIKILLLPDKTDYDSAIKNLFEHCDFDILFTHDEEFIKRLECKVKVEKLERTGKLAHISSTKIRDAISKDEPWEQWTGKDGSKLIKKFGGIKRIKKAYEKN